MTHSKVKKVQSVLSLTNEQKKEPKLSIELVHRHLSVIRESKTVMTDF